MKTTIQIKKENKIVCTLDSRYVIGYDNFQWSELALLIKVASEGFKNKNELIKNLNESESRFYETETSGCVCLALDLDYNTISIPSFPLYQFAEVNKNNCCIDLLKKGNRYYAVYEDEELPMNNVNFEDADLLKKNKVTFKEFNKINNFMENLLRSGETDFVLNNSCVIRLNCM